MNHETIQIFCDDLAIEFNTFLVFASPDSLEIEAIREGEVKGIHTIKYESDVDFLSLGHHAKSRDAFVAGVLLAARFIHGKRGVFGMEDLLKL